MSILAWVLLGLIIGLVTNKLVNQTGDSVVMDIALGVGGALAGGWVFKQFVQPGTIGLDPWSLLVAVAGAVLLLVLYRTVTGIAPRQI
jgi:uncharacterized membrane protein YeaQ/YmgE (transglycosylase-associated protein family)